MRPNVVHVVHVVGDDQITSRQREESGAQVLVDDVKDARKSGTDNSAT
jgi:hypothetical protein